VSPLRIDRFRRLEFAPGGCPAPFQFRGHEPMGGIDTAALAFTERGVIPQPLQLLPLGRVKALGLLPLGGKGVRVYIKGNR
jgi:hypothetical protein